MAQVLSTGKPEGKALSAWNWSYPVGGGDYAALYPKSWFAYRLDQLPVNLTVEQFSPILPDNYKETSYPVALYNWYAENPSNKPVTVSILFSWTNMVGWFRDTSSNFKAVLNAQNKNSFHSESLSDGKMQGIVFDRIRSGPVSEEWDGQFVIAALATPGVEVSYVTNFDPAESGRRSLATILKHGQAAESIARRRQRRRADGWSHCSSLHLGSERKKN